MQAPWLSAHSNLPAQFHLPRSEDWRYREPARLLQLRKIFILEHFMVVNFVPGHNVS